MTYPNVRVMIILNQISFFNAFQSLEAEPNNIIPSAPTNTKRACSVTIVQIWC